jgi:hypothetical protein
MDLGVFANAKAEALVAIDEASPSSAIPASPIAPDLESGVILKNGTAVTTVPMHGLPSIGLLSHLQEGSYTHWDNISEYVIHEINNIKVVRARFLIDLSW